ncbi:hypothetical protein ACIG0C_26805 [Kitasatospora aureofaciens]|uniref:hypothetical protein n=1 Tax=Kitasatospora aureofaciens TaxID=1894 RepID=UPI0037CAB9FD
MTAACQDASSGSPTTCSVRWIQLARSSAWSALITDRCPTNCHSVKSASSVPTSRSSADTPGFRTRAAAYAPP